MVSFLDYLLCVPFWVDVYYSLQAYWRDKSDLQARYTLLMLFFMAVALTLISPFLFRAIVRLFEVKNITRLIVDFFRLLSIYYYYAMLGEVNPPYRRHLIFIRLHLLVILLILPFCFFLTNTQRELLYTVDDGYDWFNFAGNIAFLSFFFWSSAIGVVHFKKQVVQASEFFLKARLFFIALACFLSFIYCSFKFGALMIQRFSPKYFPSPSFFVTVKLITIAVGMLAGLILTMPKLIELLIKSLSDYLIFRSHYYPNLYRRLCIVEDLLNVLVCSLNENATPSSHLKIYYISALGEKLCLEYEAVQLIKKSCLIFDARQGRGNSEPGEARNPSREVVDASQAQACPRAGPERSEGIDYTGRQETLSNVRQDLINNDLAGPGIGQPDDLNRLYFFSNLYQILRHIGDNYDGTGQPSGLAEDNIPLGARIIRVVNRYVTQTERGIEPETVITGLQEGSGTVFDPQIVEAFLEVLAEGLGPPHQVG